MPSEPKTSGAVPSAGPSTVELRGLKAGVP
jgi:hypothetical protein